MKKYVEAGVKNVLCTDISKDGTLQGPATLLYKQIIAEYPHLNLIASGGVSGDDDLSELERDDIPSAIVGKAWYEGRIDLEKLKGGLQ